MAKTKVKDPKWEVNYVFNDETFKHILEKHLPEVLENLIKDGKISLLQTPYVNRTNKSNLEDDQQVHMDIHTDIPETASNPHGDEHSDIPSKK